MIIVSVLRRVSHNINPYIIIVAMSPVFTRINNKQFSNIDNHPKKIIAASNHCCKRKVEKSHKTYSTSSLIKTKLNFFYFISNNGLELA